MLVSERIGQFFVESDAGRDRLEFTEYGSGDPWVVLLHGLLMPRRMQQPLARAMAAQGLHVVTLDLLGHGRSDQPADPLVYSMSAFAEQVVALLDHLGAERAVVGGTSLGANVALETAVLAPERVAGLSWRCRSSTTPSWPGSSRSCRSCWPRAMRPSPSTPCAA